MSLSLARVAAQYRCRYMTCDEYENGALREILEGLRAKRTMLQKLVDDLGEEMKRKPSIRRPN